MKCSSTSQSDKPRFGLEKLHCLISLVFCSTKQGERRILLGHGGSLYISALKEYGVF